MTDAPKVETENSRPPPRRYLVYGKPQALVNDNSLSKEEKKNLLGEWLLDAQNMSVVSEEGMTGGEPSQLEEVEHAIRELEQDES